MSHGHGMTELSGLGLCQQLAHGPLDRRNLMKALNNPVNQQSKALSEPTEPIRKRSYQLKTATSERLKLLDAPCP